MRSLTTRPTTRGPPPAAIPIPIRTLQRCRRDEQKPQGIRHLYILALTDVTGGGTPQGPTRARPSSGASSHRKGDELSLAWPKSQTPNPPRAPRRCSLPPQEHYLSCHPKPGQLGITDFATGPLPTGPGLTVCNSQSPDSDRIQARRLLPPACSANAATACPESWELPHRRQRSPSPWTGLPQTRSSPRRPCSWRRALDHHTFHGPSQPKPAKASTKDRHGTHPFD